VASWYLKNLCQDDKNDTNETVWDAEEGIKVKGIRTILQDFILVSGGNYSTGFMVPDFPIPNEII